MKSSRTKTVLGLAAVMVAALAFSATPAGAALIAYWPLSDGQAGSNVTVANDVIDAGLTFTDATSNNTTGGNTWVFDATRNRIVLSTTEGSRLTAGTQGIDRSVGFTWSLWANVNSSNLTDTGADCIIGTRNGGTWHKIDLAGTSNWAGVSYPNLADDTWHHIAYVGDSTSVRIYIDGELKGTDTSTPTTTFNGPLEIGGTSRYTEDTTGLMSDVAIWNEALTLDRIQALAAGGPVPEPATMALLGIGGLLVLRRRRRA